MMTWKYRNTNGNTVTCPSLPSFGDSGDTTVITICRADRPLSGLIDALRKFKRPRGKRDNARNGLRPLLVIGDHAPADAKRAGRRIERVGVALAPFPERLGRHGEARLFLRQTPKGLGGHVDLVTPDDIRPMLAKANLPEQFRRIAQRLKDAERLDQARNIDMAFVAIVPANAQAHWLLVGRNCGDARQSLLGHGQPRSFSSTHLSASHSWRSFAHPKCFRDLARQGVARDHLEIRNPHQRLKIGPNDVEVWRVVIIRVHPDADGTQTVQRRHTISSIRIVQLLHYHRQESRIEERPGRRRERNDAAISTLNFRFYSTSSTATVRPDRRWASEASMNGSRSPSSTSEGVPETWPVRRSFTIW